MTTSVIQYFLVRPDWGKTYSFRKRWKTVFQTSINNNEKRSADFTWPRRTLRYTLNISTFQESAYLKRILHKNIPYVWGVPVWHDESLLTAQAASGQKVIELDTTYRNFEVGADVVIFTDKDTYEVGVIASKTDSQITLVDNLAITWAASVTVYPILKCHITKSQVIRRKTTINQDIEIVASETFDTVTRYSPSISNYPTYNGYPIFNTPPNWVQPLEETEIFNYELLEYLGQNQLYTQWDNGEYRLKSRHDANNKSDIQDILDFFDYHKGRWGAFWRPSWNDDIKINASASAGDIILTVEDIDWSNYWDSSVTGELTGTHVILIWPDDSYQVTSIKHIVGTTLTLNAALTKDITTSDLNMFLVSFIYLVRFNQDEIEAQYAHDSKAAFQLSFQSLSKETPAVITTTTTTTTTTTSSTSTSSSTSTTTSTTSSTTTTSSTVSTTSTSTSTSTTSSTTTTTEPGNIEFIDEFIDTGTDQFVDTGTDQFVDTLL